MIGLLGKKAGMTQIFDENGNQRAVTLIKVGPCFVTDIKNEEKHGYSALQLAFDPVKEKNVTKPRLGHFKKSGVPACRFVREIRTNKTEAIELGSQLTVDNFQVGDYVDVQGTSIGRGYQGVVKRHHFKGGEASHGAKFGRESGSIAQGSAYPSRVPKGRRMAGQMGNEAVTTQNLKVFKVDTENNLLVVFGTVPGFDNNYLVIKMSLKRGEDRKWKLPEVEQKKKDKKEEAAKEPATKEASQEKAEKSEAAETAEKPAEKTEEPKAKAEDSKDQETKS